MKKQSRAWNLDHSKPANSGVPSLVKGPHDRSLFDSESFSFVETDLSGYIVDSNPALARMLLFPEGALVGYALSRLVPDKWHGKEAAVNAQLMQHGVTDEYEIELWKSDGSLLPVTIKKWLQTDKHGEGKSVWMLVRDVSSQGQHDDAVYERAVLLLESQIHYQTLIDQAPIAIVTCDKAGRIESVNPAVEELLGFPPAAVVGKNLRELISCAGSKPVLLEERQAQSALAKCGNGKVLPLQATISELRTKGRVLYTCFLRDVTGDVQTREALQRAHDELELGMRESTAEISRLTDALQAEIGERTAIQEQFQVALETAPNGIVVVDQHSTIITVNSRIEQLFGFARSELLGRRVDILLPERFRMRPGGPREGILAGQEAQTDGSTREFYGLRKDGLEFPIEIAQNPIQTPVGKGILVSIVDVSERKRVESELKRTAFHDALTGLPNRTLFFDNLLRLTAAAKRYGHHPFALICLDLDRFKVINDSLGHPAGDKLLVEMAQRLVECTREEDTVARLGGDEFAILLEQIRGPEDAVRVAERILQRFSDSLHLDGIEVSVEASIGIALSLTADGQPENLLRDAEMAMYQAKAKRCGYQIFDSRMHARALERMKLEIDMKRAIDRQQIHLHYQPIVVLGTGELAGFEALARWQQEGHGAIPPTKFIPLAEEAGLMGRLSRRVFHEACSQMRQWRERHPLAQNCFVSVNVSSKLLSGGNLLEEIDSVLNETGLEAQALRLEITESAIAENTRAAAHTLAELRKRQIKLCLDDFGKGFSSLNYLHRFPIDVLKIDRSFVRRLRIHLGRERGKKHPLEIIRTIIAMAQIFGMQVVAEGVEVTEQLQLLRELGCEFGQGYLFSPALEPADAARFLMQPALSC